MPKLRLEKDDYSLKASIRGDDKAYFNAAVPREGTVVLQYVNKGSMPEGAGAHFITAALKGHRALPTRQLILKNVINPESVSAFKTGVLPQDTKVGRLAASVLKQLGINPIDYRYEVLGDQFNIIIETRR